MAKTMARRRLWMTWPLIWCTGCASVAHFGGFTLHDDALYLSDVAPIRQDASYACGSACVAAVAAHWGVDFAEFKRQVPTAPGDLSGDEVRNLAERLGLHAFAFSGSMDDLRENLARGRPVIAMIPLPFVPHGDLVSTGIFNLWNAAGPRPPHWVVVVGLLENHAVIIDDPASGPLRVDQQAFDHWWARYDRLCVLITGGASAAPAQPAISANP